MIVPKFIVNRINELNNELRLAIMFNDDNRVNYLQDQISKLEDKVKTREEVYKENYNIKPRK